MESKLKILKSTIDIVEQSILSITYSSTYATFLGSKLKLEQYMHSQFLNQGFFDKREGSIIWEKDGEASEGDESERDDSES